MKKNKASYTDKSIEGKKIWPLRALPFFVLGALCLCYYLAICIFAGTHTSIVWIWLAGAVVLSGVGACFLLQGRLPYKNPVCLAAIILVSLLVLYFLVFEVCLVVNSFASTPDDVECIIVLGAAVRGEQPSKALAYRIRAAYDYLIAHPDTVAVLSGGQGAGEDISEAECMRRELTALGIDESRLILEDESTDTAENIKNSLAIIDGKYNSLAVVTNNFHVFRAKCLLRARTAAEVYAVSAPFDNPLVVHFAVREFVGFSHDALVGNLS